MPFKSKTLARFIILLFWGILVVSCNDDKKESNLAKSLIDNKVELKYAEGFEIQNKEGYKIITLKDAWKGVKTKYQYVLYKGKKPEGYENAVFVEVPIKKIACMSLTHVAFLEKLDQLESLIALSGCNYTSSAKIKERVSKGFIKEIGHEQMINYELLVEEMPDVLMAFGIDGSSNNRINKLKNLGLKVVLNGEHMETHPLGKAEWIKFVAAFYEQDKKAQELFNEIENKYMELTALTKNIKKKPTVFLSMPWNGSWHLAGGKSFQATLLKDAGADYLWASNKEKGSFVLDKEVILDQALNADFWLNQNSYGSISHVVGYDQKFENFKAVKEKKLFNNNKRINDGGGNDYWESGVVNPHIILKDMIKIFFPELVDHELYYYQRLN